MHSSKMRTSHLLAVSPSMHCSWEVSALGGGFCSGGGLLWGSLLLGGCTPGGVSGPGGSDPGRCGQGGSAIPACTVADPPMNRMTERQV